MVQRLDGAAALDIKSAPVSDLKKQKDDLKKLLASDVPEAMRDFSDLDLCELPLVIGRHGQVYNQKSLDTWISYKLEANIHKKHTAKDGAETLEVAFDCPKTSAPLRIDLLVIDGKEHELLQAEFISANQQKRNLIDLIDAIKDEKEIPQIIDKIKFFQVELKLKATTVQNILDLISLQVKLKNNFKLSDTDKDLKYWSAQSTANISACLSKLETRNVLHKNHSIRGEVVALMHVVNREYKCSNDFIAAYNVEKQKQRELAKPLYEKLFCCFNFTSKPVADLLQYDIELKPEGTHHVRPKTNS